MIFYKCPCPVSNIQTFSCSAWMMVSSCFVRRKRVQEIVLHQSRKYWSTIVKCCYSGQNRLCVVIRQLISTWSSKMLRTLRERFEKSVGVERLARSMLIWKKKYQTKCTHLKYVGKFLFCGLAKTNYHHMCLSVLFWVEVTTVLLFPFFFFVVSSRKRVSELYQTFYSSLFQRH